MSDILKNPSAMAAAAIGVEIESTGVMRQQNIAGVMRFLMSIQDQIRQDIARHTAPWTAEEFLAKQDAMWREPSGDHLFYPKGWTQWSQEKLYLAPPDTEQDPMFAATADAGYAVYNKYPVSFTVDETHYFTLIDNVAKSVRSSRATPQQQAIIITDILDTVRKEALHVALSSNIDFSDLYERDRWVQTTYTPPVLQSASLQMRDALTNS